MYLSVAFFQLDFELFLYTSNLLQVTLLKSPLLLFEEVLHVTSNPGLTVGKTANGSSWNNNVIPIRLL